MNMFNTNAINHPTRANAMAEAGRFRGLPDPDALRELVRTYLTQQHSYWPDLVGTDSLPLAFGEFIDLLTAAFEESYRTVTPQPSVALRTPPDVLMGAAYVRYSDRNSNTRSLDQQLINILRTARRENVFIPWFLVFADAAISGTTTERSGYLMLRALVKERACPFRCIIVDDLDRLNRDQVEALTFAKLIESNGNRLITASGNDSSDATFKIANSFKAMQNEFFIDDLKKKVDRGMTDAFNRGKNVGTPPIGYKTIPRLDPAGNPIITSKGTCERYAEMDDGHAATTMLSKIKEAEAMLDEKQMSLASATRSNSRPQPIPREAILHWLIELRELLEGDVVKSHEVLAKAVGKVRMKIGPKRGRAYIWNAEFEFNAIPVLLEIAKSKSCPSTHSLEFLLECSWTIPMTGCCEVVAITRAHRIARYVAKAVANGASVNALQCELQTDTRTIIAALEFARARPDDARRYSSDEHRQEHPDAKYKQLAPEVGRLVKEGYNLNSISKLLGISWSTVQRAYDHWDSSVIDEAIRCGVRPHRNTRPILAPEVYECIKQRLRDGIPIRQVTRQCGVDRSTVRRMKRLLETDRDLHDSP